MLVPAVCQVLRGSLADHRRAAFPCTAPRPSPAPLPACFFRYPGQARYADFYAALAQDL